MHFSLPRIQVPKRAVEGQEGEGVFNFCLSIYFCWFFIVYFLLGLGTFYALSQNTALSGELIYVSGLYNGKLLLLLLSIL